MFCHFRELMQVITKVIKMCKSNGYTTGNLLDFGYFKKKKKLIAIGLSKKTKLKDPQQISFVGKPKKDHGAIMSFVIENFFHKILP